MVISGILPTPSSFSTYPIAHFDWIWIKLNCCTAFLNQKDAIRRKTGKLLLWLRVSNESPLIVPLAQSDPVLETVQKAMIFSHNNARNSKIWNTRTRKIDKSRLNAKLCFQERSQPSLSICYLWSLIKMISSTYCFFNGSIIHFFLNW